MMNNSTVTLYYRSKILKEKNFILDNGWTIQDYSDPLETYLSTLTHTVIYNFQHVKHDLYLSIKINKSQDDLELNSSIKDLNYVSIKNQNENSTMYYFVTSKKWMGENTLVLELEMDTLNSIKYNVDYTVSKKSFIMRQHQDRFEYNDNNDITRHIDMKSEEINATVYKLSQINLQDINNPNNVEFALYYHNNGSNETDPIACELVPSTSFKVKSFSVSNFKINNSIIPAGKTAIVVYGYNKKSFGYGSYLIKDTRFGYVKDNQSGEINLTVVSPGVVDAPINAIAFQNDGGVIKVFFANFFPGGMGYISSINWSQVLTSTDLLNNELTVLDPDNTMNVYEMTNTAFNNGAGVSAATFENIMGAHDYNKTYTLSSATENEYSMRSISQIDRTLSTNIKIINCPYCPTQISYIENTGAIEVTDMWTVNVNDGTITLNDFNSNLVNNVTTDADNIFRYFALSNAISGHTLSEIIDTGVPRYILDSKYYHSDFYRIKFVYDSFSKVFPLEQINFKDYVGDQDYDYFKFKFVTSKNLQSKFLFIFNYEWYRPTEDYPNVLIITRNNEGVLYNSSYLNYVRTGYNFDVKAKDRDIQLGAIKLGLGMQLGTVANSAATASRILDYTKSVAQAEDNMQRKMLELQMEGVSVKNADDYDLLKAYSGNLAKLCYYAINNDTQEAIENLFYYYGYKYDRQGIPNKDSRMFFNFVQANLVIDADNNIDDNIIDDIKSKFAEGVTFLHMHHTVNYNDFVDFDQEKENIEMLIVDYYKNNQ